MNTSENHRAFVARISTTMPQAAFAEADKMAMAESVEAEKNEWRKLALKIKQEHLSK